MSKWSVKLVDYLVHRWIGTVLGVLVLAWFASGIVMIYYPYPAPTPSEELARLQPFAMPAAVIGFDSAAASAPGGGPVAGARIMQWNGRLVYSLRRAHGSRDLPSTLVDAVTGQDLSPITRDDAVKTARAVVGDTPAAIDVDLLMEGDLYLLSNEYQGGFPAYRVRFDDAHQTAVYVSRVGGTVVGVVTTGTRWTTWLGTVPHWLYIKWLYSRHIDWWLWISYALPAITALGGFTGLVYGVMQLARRRDGGAWRLTPYRGISKWHHVLGIVFGALVVTWSVSGLLEVLGPDGTPSAAQVARGLGAERARARISPVEAVRRVAAARGSAIEPIAVDITRLGGRPGYLVHVRGAAPIWVDAITGATRGELATSDAVRVATTAFDASAPIASVVRLSSDDPYYYARSHREVALPVWRVSFADADRSAIYVDAVSGRVVGFVDRETRWYRWMRDGLHSFDFPALNGQRPLWDIVLLVLLLPGTALASTGVWLAGRRFARKRRSGQ